MNVRIVTVNINRPELGLDEEFESLWQLLIGLPLTSSLHSLHELLRVHFIVLVEVSDLTDLLPEVDHHVLVLLVLDGVPVSLPLQDGVPHCQTLEVVLVEDAVPVIVVHVPDGDLVVSHHDSNVPHLTMNLTLLAQLFAI